MRWCATVYNLTCNLAIAGADGWEVPCYDNNYIMCLERLRSLKQVSIMIDDYPGSQPHICIIMNNQIAVRSRCCMESVWSDCNLITQPIIQCISTCVYLWPFCSKCEEIIMIITINNIALIISLLLLLLLLLLIIIIIIITIIIIIIIFKRKIHTLHRETINTGQRLRAIVRIVNGTRRPSQYTKAI